MFPPEILDIILYNVTNKFKNFSDPLRTVFLS